MRTSPSTHNNQSNPLRFSLPRTEEIQRKRKKRKEKKRKTKNSLLIPTHTLQLTRLIRRNLLLRAAFLVKDIIQRDPDTDRIAHMGDQIRALNAQTDGRIIDVVDEIMHIRRRQIHEAMDLRLGRGALVLREGGGGAAEYDAKVFVQVRHQFVLIGIGGPGGYIRSKRGHGAAVEKIDGRRFSIAVIALVCPVEIGHQVYIRDRVAGVAVHSFRIQDAAALVRAIGVCGPEVRQGHKIPRKGQIHELGHPGVLARVCGRVFLTQRLAGFVEGVQDEVVEGEFLDGDGEEVALVLRCGGGGEGGDEEGGGELGEHGFFDDFGYARWEDKRGTDAGTRPGGAGVCEIKSLGSEVLGLWAGSGTRGFGYDDSMIADMLSLAKGREWNGCKRSWVRGGSHRIDYRIYKIFSRSGQPR